MVPYVQSVVEVNVEPGPQVVVGVTVAVVIVVVGAVATVLVAEVTLATIAAG